MIYVHLDSPTNSTIFTNCCNAAITDSQVQCPSCEKEVYPGRESTERQRSMNRWNWAYGRQKRIYGSTS